MPFSTAQYRVQLFVLRKNTCRRELQNEWKKKKCLTINIQVLGFDL